MSKKQDSDTSTAFSRGLVWGLIVGGIIGLWKAPRSGHETRQRFFRIVNRGQTESVDEAIEQGRSIAHRNRAELAEQVNRDNK